MIVQLRYIGFVILVISHLIVFGTSLGNLTRLGGTPLVNYRLINIYIVIISAGASIFVASVAYIDSLHTNAVIARVWFEVLWTLILWIMDVGAAAAVTAQDPPTSNCTAITFPGTDLPWSLCSANTTLVIFTWVASIVLMIHIMTLLVVTIRHTRKDPSIWNFGVRDLPPWFSDESPSTTNDAHLEKGTRGGPNNTSQSSLEKLPAERSFARRYKAQAEPPLPPLPPTHGRQIVSSRPRPTIPSMRSFEREAMQQPYSTTRDNTDQHPRHPPGLPKPEPARASISRPVVRQSGDDMHNSWWSARLPDADISEAPMRSRSRRPSDASAAGLAASPPRRSMIPVAVAVPRSPVFPPSPSPSPQHMTFAHPKSVPYLTTPQDVEQPASNAPENQVRRHGPVAVAVRNNRTSVDPAMASRPRASYSYTQPGHSPTAAVFKSSLPPRPNNNRPSNTPTRYLSGTRPSPPQYLYSRGPNTGPTSY